MIIKHKEPDKKITLRALILKPDGTLIDAEQKKPITCSLGDYADCQGRCKWFSIGEGGTAYCQTIPIGKIIPPGKN